MRKYVIFGASGFIGQHFIQHFIEKSVAFEGYDLNVGEDVEFIDVRNTIEIDKNYAPNDIILNLAAVHKTPGHPDQEYFETNIKGAENICTFAKEKGIKNIIFTSSISVYGMSENKKNEETLPTPNTPYGISKLTAEYIHKNWQKEDSESRLLILRPGIVFGKNEGGNFTRLFSSLKSNRFFYPGRKDTIKACIYVKHLIEISLQQFGALEMNSQCFNYTYHPAPRIDQIVEEVDEVTNMSRNPIVVNGSLLMSVAKVAGKIGFAKLGVHPERVKKLMISNNIEGSKLNISQYGPDYTLKAGLEDWFNDCNKEGLF